MHITVYADLLFCTNFILNLFLLLCTKRLGKINSHIRRQLAGALLGSIYAVLAFFPSFTFLQSVLLKLALLPLLLLCSFRLHSCKQFAHCLILFGALQMLAAGGAYALFFMTDLGFATGAVVKNGIFYWHVPFFTVCCAALFAYGICFAGEKLLALYATRKQHIYTLQITLFEKTVTLSALLDTGNALYDCITQLPVIIAERQYIQPDNTTHSFSIPYKTLSGDVCSLPAYRPERITVNGKPAPPCVLALTEAQLCFDNTYQALLHPALIQGGFYEYATNATHTM